jgi:hypothetical protein
VDYFEELRSAVAAAGLADAVEMRRNVSEAERYTEHLGCAKKRTSTELRRNNK